MEISVQDRLNLLHIAKGMAPEGTGKAKLHIEAPTAGEVVASAKVLEEYLRSPVLANNAGRKDADEKIVAILRSVPKFGLNEEQCYALVAELRSEFPMVDLLGQAATWRNFKKTTLPLKSNSRPAKQVWEWMRIASVQKTDE